MALRSWHSTGLCETVSDAPGRPTFFVVHAVGGRTDWMLRLLSGSGVDAQFVGINAPGVLDSPSEWTVRLLAERYVHEVRARQPEGPYALVGFCLGGFIAYEIAHLLRADGHDVTGVLLVGAVFDYDGLARNSKDTVLRAQLERLRDWPPASLVEVLPHVSDDEAVVLAESDPHRLTTARAELVHAELDTYWKLIGAAGSYDASVSEVPVDLLLGADPHSDAAEAYWRERAVGPFSVHRTPAPHEGLMASRQVSQLLTRMVTVA